MKSNVIFPNFRSSRLLLIVCAFVFALHTQVQLVRASDCDEGINPDLFQDFGKEKDKRKPKHVLKDSVCEGCQPLYNKLQKALDECNAKTLEDIPSSVYGDLTDDGKAKAKQRNDALDAIAGKSVKPPKGKTKEDLKKEVKKKWEALQDKLNSCPNYTGPKTTTTPTPTPTPPSSGGGGNTGQTGGPKPNITIPEVPKCFDNEDKRNAFFKILDDLRAEENMRFVLERKAASGSGAKPDEPQHEANLKALDDAGNAAAAAPTPCPSPAGGRVPVPPGGGKTPAPEPKEQKSMLPGIPEEHGMAPKKPGDTCAVLIATGKIKVETSGTGETIGTVVNLTVQNQTDQPLNCVFPPTLFESGSGKNQHYACPSGQTVALNPHQTKTVPINGVCLNRNKPPVAKGVSGDLVMNEANPSAPQNPNSHLPATDAGKLLRSCAAKYTAADQLQKSGALKNLPYHDPQKQKDIVVQWSTWTDPQICQIVGTTPATKDDLKKVVYKQVEKKGPMSPETKKKVDQGINTIFEKVELTTAKAKDLEKPEGESSPPTETPAG